MATGGANARPQPLSALESIVRVAMQSCGTEAAALCFTDRKLRWLSTSCGLDESSSCEDLESSLLNLAGGDEFLFNRADQIPEFTAVPQMRGGSCAQSGAGTNVPSRGGDAFGMIFVLDHRPGRISDARVGILRELAAVVGAIVEGWLNGDLNVGDAGAAEQRYRELFDNSTDVVFFQNLAGELTAINQAGERLLGYRREELVGRMIAEVIAPDHTDIVRLMALEQFGGGCPQAHKIQFLSKQKRAITLEVTGHLLFEHGKPVGMMGFARNRGGSSGAASAGPSEAPAPHAGELAKVSAAVEHLHRLNGTAYGEMNSVFDDHLRAGCEILGVEIGMIGELENGSLRIRAGSRHADAPHVGITLEVKGTRFSTSARLRKTRTFTTARPLRRQPIYQSGAAGFFVSIPVVLGDRLWGLLAFASREPKSDLDERLVSAVELVARCLGQKLLETMVFVKRADKTGAHTAGPNADRDGLTGLPNERAIRHTLEESVELARRGHCQVAAVLIDLDRFKRFNDALGHSVGDRLLRRVGERLRRCLGNDDVLGHMGADRYLCILGRLDDQSEANRIVRCMLVSIRRPFRVAGMELFVTASFGISVYPKDGDAASSLLWNAEAALDQAKREGRNKLAFFAPQRRPTGLRVREIANALRGALAGGEFELRFQPQFDMEYRLEALETLLSWRHPDLGRVTPEQFIPVAEETGLIVPIGAWVVRQACRQSAAWRRRGLPPVKLAVNVSALQFAQADFTDVIADALADAALPASLLELEVTESVVMRDIRQSAKVMEGLQKLGVEISIDDFGTGYSSLSYLRRLPANALKIDRSFLEDSDSSTSTRALIETIVSLAHDLGLSVVGEGVETVEQFDLLRRAGCDRAQGHLFGLPLSARKATQLLRDAQAAGHRASPSPSPPSRPKASQSE